MPKSIQQLHRVFVKSPDTRRPTDPGHPLFLPQQGQGRIDDPMGEYRVWYCSEDWRVAICEKFRDYGVWSPLVLEAPPHMPEGSVMALATVTGEFSLCDVDDVHTLQCLQMRPSRVVTPDRAQTQAWGQKIYRGLAGEVYDGATWWCHWNADHSAAGLWDLGKIADVRIEVMSVKHLQEAASLLDRMVLPN